MISSSRGVTWMAFTAGSVRTVLRRYWKLSGDTSRDGRGRQLQVADAGVDAGEWGGGVDPVKDDAGEETG